jgi:hypothetical protein
MAKQKFYLMIADFTGDTRLMITWDPQDPKSVAEVKARFAELKAKGYIFYECEGFEGEYKPKGMPMKQLDETVGRVIAEQYFDDLEFSQKEEVILTNVKNPTEETSVIDPVEDVLQNGTTLGAMKMPSGG